ncbi:hypothetical protein M5W83_23025 [Paenibacillus thiaminolyticus]|uniref:Uncharacterized protein n=1 Tax=Paenibacillus thiaminolyticus TaxID=49283 RepID=A0ABT4G1R9_PANTH|nr:hypothetical protein [Paenibacillus thiaminolyticus]MCY9535425.1 hypothetical protein [Paenibacillus thiaminolyticus]MCY9604847.1 hypothetical protein [Paenibacillus thiaminolyticus]MCY9610034.1 hypothetical protein [Paenibacillus thiaminolyticus]MCY9615127.1 hypothetical protein [Paenibacillus thiaminolyticus]MCY9621120.1 hypothetical protein [Paenibacillus thiaminolyticus]
MFTLPSAREVMLLYSLRLRKRKLLPERWTARLNDTLYAEVSGFHPIASRNAPGAATRCSGRLTGKR